MWRRGGGRVAPNSGVVADSSPPPMVRGRRARGARGGTGVCKWEAAVGAVGAAFQRGDRAHRRLRGRSSCDAVRGGVRFRQVRRLAVHVRLRRLTNVTKGEDESANKPLSVRAFGACGDAPRCALRYATSSSAVRHAAHGRPRPRLDPIRRGLRPALVRLGATTKRRRVEPPARFVRTWAASWRTRVRRVDEHVAVLPAGRVCVPCGGRCRRWRV